MQDQLRIKGQPPVRCTNLSCKVKLFRQDAKGCIPVLGMVQGIICECHKCQQISYFNMAVFAIDEWLQGLPEMPVITKKEADHFAKFVEDNFDSFMVGIRKNSEVLPKLKGKEQ